MSQFTPINQKRLTNVSVVKYLIKTDKKRHRFEIACYPNKVIAWRQKLESRLSEVLQSDLIYKNVSKAEIASKEHLKDAFQTADICYEKQDGRSDDRSSTYRQRTLTELLILPMGPRMGTRSGSRSTYLLNLLDFA